MALAIDQLPNDVATLKRLLVERDAEVVQRLVELEAQRAEVLVARLLIEKLKLQIARLRRIQFGRRSEQHDARVVQLELIVEELETSLAASPALAETSPASSPRTPPVRRPLPATLPRETVLHAAACTCPDCGGVLKQIGEDVAEQLEFIPEHFKVIRHVRPKFACGKCSTIVQAAAPSRPIDKGIAGPGLLAHVAVSKYLDHLPLYRQSEIYARQGIDLERSTLADWIGGIARLVTPLAELIGRYVTAATKIHADDTSVPVLDPGRGKTKTGRLWVYVRDDRPAGSIEAPAAFYRYTPTREGAHPRAHLKDFQGTLQADGFSGFDGLYVDGRVREAACWAHARRKFYDLHADTRSPARRASADANPGFVRDRAGDPGQVTRRALAGASGARRSAVGRLAAMDAGNPGQGIGQVGTCWRDQLRAQTLGRPHAVSRRRRDRDRQQCCGTRTARAGKALFIVHVLFKCLETLEFDFQKSPDTDDPFARARQ